MRKLQIKLNQEHDYYLWEFVDGLFLLYPILGNIYVYIRNIRYWK